MEMNLKQLQQQTRDAWNTEVFSKVTTSSANTTKLQQLYTALYFMHLMPQNKTGENPLWQSTEPYYDDIFTFWDTVSKHLTGSHAHSRLQRNSIGAQPHFSTSCNLLTMRSFYAP